MPGSKYIDVAAAIQEAEKVLAEKSDVMERQDIIRTDLRNAVKMKAATPEQAKWIGEHFPMRQRQSKNKGGDGQ
jgi:hypothetical protein